MPFHREITECNSIVENDYSADCPNALNKKVYNIYPLKKIQLSIQHDSYLIELAFSSLLTSKNSSFCMVAIDNIFGLLFSKKKEEKIEPEPNTYL